MFHVIVSAAVACILRLACGFAANGDPLSIARVAKQTIAL